MTLKYLLLNLPNPLNSNIYRGFAGGFATSGFAAGEILTPIFLLYGASAMKEMNVYFEVIDAQGLKYSSNDTLNAVARIKPDIVITWVSLPSFHNDLNLAKKIQEMVKKVVVLGAVCNVMPEKVLEKVDIIVKGGYPYYSTVKNIVENFEKNDFKNISGAVYSENGRLIENPFKYEENIDNIWLDVYKKLPIESYIGNFDGLNKSFKCTRVLTSVGCPYPCMYCPYPIGYGKKTIQKSINKTLEEIKYLKENFGINGFVFRAQNFTTNKGWVNDLCNAIMNEKLNIHWMAETRADLVTKELLMNMKKAGCFRIHYGVETGDEEMEKIGKPNLDIPKIKEMIKITRELRIFTVAHMIIGLPGESKQTLDRTIKTLIEIDPDAINVNFITPYPGTKLFDFAQNRDLIETYDFSKYTSFKPIMRTEILSIDDLISARKNMRTKFTKYKILHDNNFRNRYFKSIPKKIKSKMMGLIG